MNSVVDIGDMNIEFKNGEFRVIHMFNFNKNKYYFKTYEEAIEFRNYLYIHTSRTNTGYKFISYKDDVLRLKIVWNGKNILIRKHKCYSVFEYLDYLQKYVNLVCLTMGFSISINVENRITFKRDDDR